MEMVAYKWHAKIYKFSHIIGLMIATVVFVHGDGPRESV